MLSLAAVSVNVEGVTAKGRDFEPAKGALGPTQPWSRPCVLVPAYQAARSIAPVVRELQHTLPEVPILVIDDGSTDGTGAIAARSRAEVVAHGQNRGKGAALATGLATAHARGFDVALTVDADGQHPAASARIVLDAAPDRRAVVLGTRDLVRDGAPRANQFSNGLSNFFLSRFSGVTLADTQCGLRRYPVAETLALGARAEGYAFEAEVILRAVAAGLPIVQTPVAVIYPPGKERVTHFDSVRDPARIVAAVTRTLLELRRG